MTQLYRIKPLKWKSVGFDDLQVAGRYKTYHGRAYFDGDPFYCATTQEQAKAACESHRRNLLEAELAPAYQPTTELPTEPGLYWCRTSNRDWLAFRILRLDGRLVANPCWGPGTATFEQVDENHWLSDGQWIRIPDPNEESEVEG